MESLEARTADAQRAYLRALVAWEQSLHAVACELCQQRGSSLAELIQASDDAEAEKERLRIVFRTLLAELGYVPPGQGIGLPAVEAACRCNRSIH